MKKINLSHSFLNVMPGQPQTPFLLSVSFVQILVLISAMSVLSGCQRNTAAEDGQLTVRFPEAKTDLKPQSKSAVLNADLKSSLNSESGEQQKFSTSPSASKWILTDPSLSDQFNCFALTVEAEDIEAPRNSCARLNATTISRPQLIFGGFPAGSTQTLKVPSGENRKFSLIGFKTDSISNCVNFRALSNGFPSQHFSAPVILSSTSADLAPGGETSLSLSIPETLINVDKFEDCSPISFSGGATSNPINGNFSLVGVSPAAGDIAGGTSLQIFGTGFTSETTAVIGGLSCGSMVVTPTLITCTTPAHVEGLVDLVVTRGIETATLNNVFTYSSLSLVTVADVIIAENSGSATLTVTLSKPADQNVQLSYTSMLGTATAADFTSRNGSLGISAGTLMATIVIPIIDDSLDENSENFSVVLSGLTANAIFADSSAQVTITDNDSPPIIQLTSSSQTITESAGVVTFGISLDAASGLAASVNFTVSGTATAGGGDHNLADGTVTISAGTTVGNYTFNVIDDAALESMETIIVTLNSSTNSTLGGLVTHTISLSDNEVPTASLSSVPGNPSSLTTLAIDVGGAEVSQYQYGINPGSNCTGVTYGSFVSASANITDNISGLGDGNYTICVLAKSTSSVNQTAPTTHTWQKDTTAPTALLTGTPAAVTNVPGLNVDVQGNDVVSYRYKISGTNDCSSASGYGSTVSESVNITDTLSDGPHYLCVLGADLLGNEQAYGSATFINWTLDQVPPNTPSGLALNSPSTSPNIDSTPDIAVSGVTTGDTVFLYSNATCTIQVGSTVAPAPTANVTSASLGDGVYTFAAKTRDPAGNMSSCSGATVSYVLDTSPPTAPSALSDRAIGASAYYSPIYSWAASTDVGTGLVEYEFSIGTSSGGLEVVGWNSNGLVTTRYFSGLSLVSGTTYYFNVRAKDAAGNLSSLVTDSWIYEFNPAWIQQAYVKASQVSATDTFGSVTAIDQDLLVVGSPQEDSSLTTIQNGGAFSTNEGAANAGAVYVYRRSGVNWTQTTFIKALNAQASDLFGQAIAVSGDTIVVGAPQEDSSFTTITNGPMFSWDEGSTNSGAVYVYRYDGTVWTLEAFIKAPNSVANIKFGTSVAIDKDTIVVGAPFEDAPASGPLATAPSTTTLADAGAAYVFTRTGTTWSFQYYLKSNNADTTDFFGMNVAVHGDTVAVGVPFEDSNQATITNGTSSSGDNAYGNSGAVYIFTRSGVVWTQQAFVKAPNVGTSDQFGDSISIFENHLVVGAWNEASSDTSVTNGTSASSDNTFTASGAAYVFNRSGSNWSHQAFLKPSNNVAPGMNFGSSVGIFGSTIVVGAPLERSNATTPSYGSTASNNTSLASAGAAYVFQRSGSAWSQAAYLKATNTGVSDNFGKTGIGISGSTIVVGAPEEDSNQNTITNGTSSSIDNSITGAGAVYVFEAP